MRSLLLIAALAACSPLAAETPVVDQWRAVEVEAVPLDFGAERIGQLRFRGGLELRSTSAVFGGLSGLEVLEDGRMIAISDNGDWFEAFLVLDGEGQLVGLSGARTAFMRDENALPFTDKEAGDSEGLTQLSDGRFAVSFEQTQTIRIYDLNRDGPFGAASPGPRLDEVRGLPDNVGLEALAATRDGALLVGAEGGGERRTRLWRAPLDATAPVAPQFWYEPARGFSLTALDALPDGGFVALERFYAPIVGARGRIVRLSSEDVSSERDAPLTGEELALIAPPLAIDNFEGVAAVAMPNGATRLYIVSDNNFSERQRTLLLAFDLEAAD